MGFERFLKMGRLPTSWCGGCGLGIILKAVCQVFDELGYSSEDTVVVSGIGCSGRSAGYFNLDTVHGAHGRAIPLAEGIKAANERLNVVVLSGDGDLLGIGGNHLIHAGRRNSDLTAICADNEIYGMTGRQRSPTTGLGVRTLTSPNGNEDRPLDAQALVRAHGNFYARTTTYHLAHLKRSLRAALEHRGFSFVDVKCQCITNHGRRLGFRTGYEMLMLFKDAYKIRENAERLAPDEIGVTV